MCTVDNNGNASVVPGLVYSARSQFHNLINHFFWARAWFEPVPDRPHINFSSPNVRKYLERSVFFKLVLRCFFLSNGFASSAPVMP